MIFSSTLERRCKLRYVDIRDYCRAVGIGDDWGRGLCQLDNPSPALLALWGQLPLWTESVDSELCQQLGSIDLLEALGESYAKK